MWYGRIFLAIKVSCFPLGMFCLVGPYPQESSRGGEGGEALRRIAGGRLARRTGANPYSGPEPRSHGIRDGTIRSR